MDYENPVKFFSSEENLNVIRQFHAGLHFVETPDASGKSDQFVTLGLKEILYSIQSNAKEYDERCQANIKWIGKEFISALRNYSENKKEGKDKLRSIFVMAYRFLCELDFSMPGDLNMDLGRIILQINDHLDEFEPREKSAIIYANFTMPVNIAKKIINHDNIQNVKQFNNLIAQAETKKEEWTKELDKRGNEVKLLSDKLDEYKTAFNFVGLYDGFRKLADDKNKEKFWLFLSLIAIGLVVISPLISEVAYILLNQDAIAKHKDIIVYAALPMVTFELILIYFFRIILFNYKSVKALLVQIELRKTLCQFIQNYSDYSKNIKEKDASSLEKFENLIFSGLITNEDNLPSTFDGIEQLTKLVKSVK